MKNNGLQLTGLTFYEEGCNMAPTIYVNEPFQGYREGRSAEEIEERIIALYEEHRGQEDFDTEAFSDFSRVKDKICYRLVNAAKNRNLLKEIPHRLFQDLAVTYYVAVEIEGDIAGTVHIRNDMLQIWDTDEETLYKLACRNTPDIMLGRIEPMTSMLWEMIGIYEESLRMQPEEDIGPEGISCVMRTGDKDEFAYIASNRRKTNGAAIVLYDKILKAFADKTGHDFYILPSSVHEVLLVPILPGAPKEQALLRMVREVNASHVAAEEILSDNIYLYHKESGRLEMIGA